MWMKMKIKINYLTFWAVWGLILIASSCTHDPFPIDDPDVDPIDTMKHDTTMVDTTGTMPCDSNVIYFQQQVLPIIRGNCAISGCHDVTSATDDVILTDYTNIIRTGEVEAFNLGDSKLYEVITEDDPKDVMPPTGRLPLEQINIIATWILQGAQDNACENASNCEKTDVSYSKDIAVIMRNSCNGCHASNVATAGVVTDSYDALSRLLPNNRLLGAISWENGFSRMPFNQDQIDSCNIELVKTWINEGGKNN